jgi:hypothetical protein
MELKHNKILILFLLFTLFGTFSQVSASEITGNLSSSGATTQKISTKKSIVVKRVSYGSQKIVGSGGIVAAPPTTNTLEAPTDSTALSPDSGGISFSGATDIPGLAYATSTGVFSTPTDSTSPTSFMSALSGFDTGTWFWIILLTALLISFIIYMYTHPIETSKVRKV